MHTRIVFIAGISFILGCGSAAAVDGDSLAADFQKLIGNSDPSHEDWSLHAQATETLQAYPSFPAAYSGANSLSSDAQWRNSTTATLFLGRRLWQGAEVYYDRELYEGEGLSNTLGVAGYPNGEANKSGSYAFKTNGARLFLRQVIGLGGPQEQIASDQNQLAGKQDISRITLTAGKLAATDIFDNNTYAHDSRTQYLNWAVSGSGAWDYPSNSRGYTDGAAVEFNQAGWALRWGIFMEPSVANEGDLAWRGLSNAGQVAELEERYSLRDRPGKLRLLAFLNTNRAANLSDVLGAPDVNAAVLQERHYGDTKYGFAINAEQELAEGVGAFARLSWNNGLTEDWMFTNIDESATAGLSVSGKRWGRDDDTWGIAGVINGLSPEDRKFFEQGGLGILIGDGALHYSPETIFETYYNFKINHYLAISPDYQFVLNPAYNVDRGPVNIFAVRLHAGF